MTKIIEVEVGGKIIHKSSKQDYSHLFKQEGEKKPFCGYSVGILLKD